MKPKNERNYYAKHVVRLTDSVKVGLRKLKSGLYVPQVLSGSHHFLTNLKFHNCFLPVMDEAIIIAKFDTRASRCPNDTVLQAVRKNAGEKITLHFYPADFRTPPSHFLWMVEWDGRPGEELVSDSHRVYTGFTISVSDPQAYHYVAYIVGPDGTLITFPDGTESRLVNNWIDWLRSQAEKEMEKELPDMAALTDLLFALQNEGLPEELLGNLEKETVKLEKLYALAIGSTFPGEADAARRKYLLQYGKVYGMLSV